MAEAAQNNREVVGSKRPAASHEITSYDFKNPSRVPKEQTHTIRLIHETFAGSAGVALSAYLNSEILIQLDGLEQLSFHEYIMSLSNPTCISTFDMQPLNGYGLIEINSAIVFALIDKMLGGDGAIPSLSRSFTELEFSIIKKLVNILLKELSLSWNYIINLSMNLKEIQANPSFVRVVSHREACLVATLRLKVKDTTGLITIAIPYVNLEPIGAKLGNEQWNNRYSAKQSDDIMELHRRNFLKLKVEAIAKLGAFDISMVDLLNLKPGDLLNLSHKTKNPIDLIIAGYPKFKVRPGLVGKKKGVMIQSEIVKE